MDEIEENFQYKNDENLDLPPDDLQAIVQLFKTNAKSLKEKYGAYNINMPLSNHIITCFDDYFEVSKSISTNNYILKPHYISI